MHNLLGRPLAAVGLAVAVLVCAAPSMALPPSLVAPSYESLIARLEQTPSAMEAEALSDAANARAQQARALPNPTIGLEAENVYGTGPYTGLGNADTTVSISQPLELFGQRGARINAARAEANAVGLRSEQMLWQAADSPQDKLRALHGAYRRTGAQDDISVILLQTGL